MAAKAAIGLKGLNHQNLKILNFVVIFEYFAVDRQFCTYHILFLGVKLPQNS